MTRLPLTHQVPCPSLPDFAGAFGFVQMQHSLGHYSYHIESDSEGEWTWLGGGRVQLAPGAPSARDRVHHLMLPISVWIDPQQWDSVVRYAESTGRLPGVLHSEEDSY